MAVEETIKVTLVIKILKYILRLTFNSNFNVKLRQLTLCNVI